MRFTGSCERAVFQAYGTDFSFKTIVKKVQKEFSWKKKLRSLLNYQILEFTQAIFC